MSLFGEVLVEENNYIYFVPFFGNALYRYDKKRKENFWLGSFKGQSEDEWAYRLFGAMIKVDEKIFVAPSCGNSIINIYDIKEKQFGHIDLRGYLADKEMMDKDKLPCKFVAIYRFKDYLYFLGCTFPAIVRLSLSNMNVDYIDGWHKLLKDYTFYCQPGIIRDAEGLFPFAESAGLLKIDLETGVFEIIEVKSAAQGFMGVVAGIENDLWVLDGKELKCINISENGDVLEEVKLNIKADKGKNHGIIKNPIGDGKGMYIFPVWTDHVYYFSFYDKKLEICEEFDEIISRELGKKDIDNRRVMIVSPKPNYVYMIEYHSQYWNEIYLPTREYNSFIVNEDLLHKWSRGVMVFAENNNELNDFIRLVKQQ